MHSPTNKRCRQAVLLSIVIGLFISVAEGRKAPFKIPPTPVEVIEATQSTYQPTYPTQGILKAQSSIALKTEVAGVVEAVKVPSGHEVAPGAVLLSLKHDDLDAQLQQAKAALRLSLIKKKRHEKLHETKQITPYQWEDIVTQTHQLEAQVNHIIAMIDQHHLVAPFQGHLGVWRLHPGEYVSAGTKANQLTNKDTFVIHFDLPQSKAYSMNKHQPIQVEIPDQQGSIQARWLAQDPALSEQHQMHVKAVVELPKGPIQQTLHSGSFVRLVVPLEAESKKAVRLPLTAILSKGDTHYVNVVNDEETIVQQEVTLGQQDGTYVNVLEGIKPKQRVVITGQNRVAVGKVVKAVPSTWEETP